MSRDVQVHLAISGSFMARRWEQPESWMKLTREAGFRWHEFSGDVLDPNLTGDRDSQMKLARSVKQAGDESGVRVLGFGAGRTLEGFHGLSSSDPLVRQRLVEWSVSAMELCVAMGGSRLGGRMDVIPSEVVLRGEDDYKEAVRRQHEIFRDLCQIAADKGLSSMYQPQGCVPAEVPCTIKQAEDFLIQVNKNSRGCAVHLSIDVGRMAGQHYRQEGKDSDYLAWLSGLAGFCEVIRIHQTPANACAYLPFTEENNKRGHIDIPRLLEALRYGHDHHEQSWVSEVLDPVTECWLVVDVRPDFWLTEQQIVMDLRETAEYLGEWIPEEGLSLTI